METKNRISGLTHHHVNIVFCVPGIDIMLISIDTEKIDKVCEDRSVGDVSRIGRSGNIICYTRSSDSTVTNLDSDNNKE